MKRKEHKLISNVECKHCYKCDQWLPLSCFGSDKSKWDGLNASCKECEKIKRDSESYKKKSVINARNYYEKNKNSEDFIARRKANIEKFKENNPFYSQEYHQRNKEKDNERNCKNYWKNKEKYNLRSRKNNARIYKETHPHAGEKVVSQGEEFVADWLQKHGIFERFDFYGRHYYEIFGEIKDSDIYYIRQYWFEDLKDKKKLLFDFYIPKLNVIIEVNGIKHYAPKSFSKNATKEDRLKEFAETTLHDRKKCRYAEEHGIEVFDIKYGFGNYKFPYVEAELNKIMQPFLKEQEGKEMCA